MSTPTPPSSAAGTSERPARPAAPPAGPRKIPAPRMLPEAAPYWAAANAGKLVIKTCSACGQVHFYPRDICPHCGSAATVWQDAAGTGTVYSFSTMGKGEAAYTLAFVTLDEGVTLMTNLVGYPTEQMAIGQRVKVCFVPTEGPAGPQQVPMFTLA